MHAEPDEQGFWGIGNFDQDIPGVDNPWKDGSKMAPFDREVSVPV